MRFKLYDPHKMTVEPVVVELTGTKINPVKNILILTLIGLLLAISLSGFFFINKFSGKNIIAEDVIGSKKFLNYSIVTKENISDRTLLQKGDYIIVVEDGGFSDFNIINYKKYLCVFADPNSDFITISKDGNIETYSWEKINYIVKGEQNK